MEWLFRFKSYTPASTFTLLSTMLDASLGPWSHSSAWLDSPHASSQPKGTTREP